MDADDFDALTAMADFGDPDVYPAGNDVLYSWVAHLRGEPLDEVLDAAARDMRSHAEAAGRPLDGLPLRWRYVDVGRLPRHLRRRWATAVASGGGLVRVLQVWSGYAGPPSPWAAVLLRPPTGELVAAAVASGPVAVDVVAGKAGESLERLAGTSRRGPVRVEAYPPGAFGRAEVEAACAAMYADSRLRYPTGRDEAVETLWAVVEGNPGTAVLLLARLPVDRQHLLARLS